MTSAKPKNTVPFITILNLESKNGYTNRAVIGGLDRFIEKWAAENHQARLSPQLRQLLAMTRSYADMALEERKRWVTAVMSVLSGAAARNGVIAKPSGQRTPPPVNSYYPDAEDTLALDNPVLIMKGVGDNMAKKFARLGVNTIRDIIYFFPRRFMDFSRKSTVASLVTGKEQTVFANVWESRTTQLGRMKSSEAVVGDETGNIRAVWFNQPWVARQIKTNMRIALSGKVSQFNYSKVFENPEWEVIEEKELVHTGRMVPVYQLTQGLFPRQTRAVIKGALDKYIGSVCDFLPAEIRRRCQLLDLRSAIRYAHYPEDYAQQNTARQRLAFDELFMLQLGVFSKKREWQVSQPGHRFEIDKDGINTFTGSLPFNLTGDQEKVIGEICADLNRETPMSRLLQGDVGSGKTVVATVALLIAARNRFQSVLMAPTGILAEQHFATLHKLMSAVCQESGRESNIYSFKFNNIFLPGLKIALLTGSLGSKDKAATQERIKTGEIDIVIGTHALIQKGVSFNRLGLVVIDEQHRFGVLQRQALRQKGFNPHLLVMTATPIPRTLALTIYGDLDVSVISEMPPGRQVIRTRWLRQNERDRAYNFIRKQVTGGRQAFIICPLIEESENLDVKAAMAEYERLSADVFPEMRLGLLHGKMKGVEKENVMLDFKQGKLDILVSTSVVEVGIDVPNATVMLVEAADRFGLSQLHQFRGRVGRGENQSYCLLLAENPSEYGQERLKAIEEISDGFLLAEKDLQLRGPGEFFGTRQSGLPDLKMARLTDVRILEMARREASILFQVDPDLNKPDNMLLAGEYNRIWHKSIKND